MPDGAMIAYQSHLADEAKNVAYQFAASNYQLIAGKLPGGASSLS